MDFLCNNRRNLNLSSKIGFTPNIRLQEGSGYPFRTIADLKGVYGMSERRFKESYVDETAVTSSSKIVKSVVMAGCRIGKECSVVNSVLGVGVVLGDRASLKDCRVGPRVKIEDGTRLEGAELVEEES